jgi:hypothetical protein
LENIKGVAVGAGLVGVVVHAVTKSSKIYKMNLCLLYTPQVHLVSMIENAEKPGLWRKKPVSTRFKRQSCAGARCGLWRLL